MYKAVIHYRERKLLSGIDVSEKAGKVSKTANALDVSRLPTPLKRLKRFLRRYPYSKDMAENGFQKCFDDLHKRWQKCVVAQGSYFEGGCVPAA
ncbi:hypothetical protein TNCV_4344131 [Trichonephila clavipes]|nr:hypothetical protein TNCV_4344131 [Trichonephila clavipes]